MPRAVVLDLEQLGMRLDQRDGQRVAPQPEAGDEQRGGDLLLDQRGEDALVGMAAAGVERHRHPHGVPPCRRRQVQRRLDQLRRTGGGRQGKGDQEKGGKG